MEIFESIIKLLTENGISVACVLYLMYFQFVTMRDILKTMQETVIALNNVNERLYDIENKIDKNKGNKSKGD